MSNETSAARVRALNDFFRTSLIGGRIVLTHRVGELSEEKLRELLTAVKNFDNFTDDNDPHGEHDFGAIEMHDTNYYWKIDYYDPSLTSGSENPADPSKTIRVLSVMLAAEY
jgi:hypothetical protein